MAVGRKTGGRTAGTPNKATAATKTFLEGVFSEVFASDDFRAALIKRLIAIDEPLLKLLLPYYAGRPAQQVDLTGSLDVNLAELIAGPLPTAAEPEEPGE